MQIHATNIQGLGASQVVKSFLDSCSNLKEIDSMDIYLPSTGYLKDYNPKRGNIIRYKRKFPNSISRVFECLFSTFIFSNEKTIILGDIPLRGIYDQVVLVHQPNLIYPKINPYSSKSFNFRMSRFLFFINQKFASKIIVQTGAMAEDLINSYPKIKNKVLVIPQPVPNWLKISNDLGKVTYDGKMILFYPAAFYPHKKHDFIKNLDSYLKINSIDLDNVEIWVTLEENEFKNFKSIKFLKNVGRLSSAEMNLFYEKVDALLFLSSMESYGLPLIEAITLNLPILTVDFNYSRWICDDSAYYFEPYSEASFLVSLNRLKNDLEESLIPNYSKVLTKFPDSWDVIVKAFFEIKFDK